MFVRELSAEKLGKSLQSYTGRRLLRQARYIISQSDGKNSVRSRSLFTYVVRRIDSLRNGSKRVKFLLYESSSKYKES